MCARRARSFDGVNVAATHDVVVVIVIAAPISIHSAHPKYIIACVCRPGVCYDGLRRRRHCRRRRRRRLQQSLKSKKYNKNKPFTGIFMTRLEIVPRASEIARDVRVRLRQIRIGKTHAGCDLSFAQRKPLNAFGSFARPKFHSFRATGTAAFARIEGCLFRRTLGTHRSCLVTMVTRRLPTHLTACCYLLCSLFNVSGSSRSHAHTLPQ